MEWFGILGFLLFPFLAVAVLRRLRERMAERARGPRLDDEAVERILAEGRIWLEDDEPLDPDAIREEEDRFWREARWDGATLWDGEEERDEGNEPWTRGR
jgi:hypothetical protein